MSDWQTLRASGYWQHKSLHDMNEAEWEALCDGCGKCCLVKLEDEDDGEIYYTDIACDLLDSDTCRCRDYEHRLQKEPDCVRLKADMVEQFQWLPFTCAYRLLAEGAPLPAWHPLVSGDKNSMMAAGATVRNRVKAKAAVPEDDWQEHVIYWVDEHP